MPRKSTTLEAFMACSMDLTGDQAPEWIHLLPAGSMATVDGRMAGTKINPDELKLVSRDGLDQVNKVPIDINHAIAKQGSQGLEAPAYAWIDKLQNRNGETWAHVASWSPQGAQLYADKAYIGISAELMVDKVTGKVLGIRGASLTNSPNVKGLTPIFHTTEDNQEEDDMDKFLHLLCTALAIGLTTDQSKVIEAITALKTKADKGDEALNAQLMTFAEAAGFAKDAKDLKPEAVLMAFTEKTKANADMVPKAVVDALRAEMMTMGKRIDTVQVSAAKTAAETYIDDQVKKGRMGVRPLRDHYVARMMTSEEEAVKVRKEVEAMPLMAGGAIVDAAAAAAAAKNGEYMMTAVDKDFCRSIGITEDAFKKQRQAELAAKAEA